MFTVMHALVAFTTVYHRYLVKTKADTKALRIRYVQTNYAC